MPIFEWQKRSRISRNKMRALADTYINMLHYVTADPEDSDVINKLNDLLLSARKKSDKDDRLASINLELHEKINKFWYSCREDRLNRRKRSEGFYGVRIMALISDTIADVADHYKKLYPGEELEDIGDKMRKILF